MLSNFALKNQFIIFLVLIFSTVNARSETPPLNTGRIIIIDKARKKLVVVADGEQAAEFPAAFGIDPDSDKYKSFDGATPEGLYVITYKKYKSEFHRFLGISYPNLADAARGLAQGVISLKEYKKIYQDIRKSGHTPCGTGLGCGIGIHGGGVFRYFGKNKETDWTEGCIALDNPAMEKLFNLCRPGDPVIIFNSRRNLCGIIRPFTHIKDMDENGVPICPDGICTYQVEVPVSWGRMIIIIKEGKDYGRSMKVMGYKDDVQKPFFILVDRNADGYLSTVDSISGSIADEKRPDATYERIREAVVSALSRGDILDSVDGR